MQTLVKKTNITMLVQAEVASTFIKFIGIVFATCFLHWAIINIYGSYCAPPGFLGAFVTFISLGSPVCQFMNYIQYELAKHYITIWGAAGIALISWLIAKFTSA